MKTHQSNPPVGAEAQTVRSGAEAGSAAAFAARLDAILGGIEPHLIPAGELFFCTQDREDAEDVDTAQNCLRECYEILTRVRARQ